MMFTKRYRCWPALAVVVVCLFVSTARGEDSPLKDPSPERFAKQIEAFAQADKNRPAAKEGIVFVGSSSIRRWDLPRYFGKTPDFAFRIVVNLAQRFFCTKRGPTGHHLRRRTSSITSLASRTKGAML